VQRLLFPAVPGEFFVEFASFLWKDDAFSRAIFTRHSAHVLQEMGDTQHPVIVLHNVSLNDMKAVLAFIYRGQCVVSKEQLPGLLSLARLLKIQGLCDMKVRLFEFAAEGARAQPTR
jgi:hypothetical protein